MPKASRHEHFMTYAIELAKKAKMPPSEMRVGAIVVYGSEIIGSGYYQKPAGKHAEVQALNEAKDHPQIKDATLYVTLEPCSVYARTPSCADAIIASGIKKVVVGSIDMSPRVNRFGIELLKRNNIVVTENVMNTKCIQLNKANLEKRKKQKITKPHVGISVAASVDGKLTDATNRQTKISTKADVAHSNNLRALADAVMVGGNTFLQDDPSLIIRDKTLREKAYKKKGYAFPMKVVVIDKIPSNSNLSGNFFTKEKVKKIFFTTKKSSKKAIERLQKINQVEVFILGKEKVNLKKALSMLAKFGVKNIYVEGGGNLNYELLKAKLVNELQIRHNATIFGGTENPSLVTGQGFTKKTAPQLKLQEVKKIDSKTLLVSYRVVDIDIFES